MYQEDAEEELVVKRCFPPPDSSEPPLLGLGQ